MLSIPPTCVIRHGRHLAALAVAGTAVACSESSAPGVPELQVTFTNSADSVFFGHRMQGWVHTYSTAQAVPRDSVEWSSSDTLVAVVDQQGVVLGVGLGTARITVDRPGERGERTIRVVPYEPVPDRRFTLLSRGIDGVCAQAEDGGVFCGVCIEVQGGNIYCGSLPAGDSVPAFSELPGSRALRFTNLHVSSRSHCGLALDDRAYCWGQNAAGHFGTSDRLSTRYSDAPAVVAAGRRFSAFSVGGHVQTCAIGLTDPTVYCFGHNDAGQVGRGTISGFDSTFAPVLGQLQARMVVTGHANTCAIDLRDELYCWGGGYGPSFEQMEERTAGVPIHLAGAPRLTALSIGLSPRMCGLDATGVAWCWSRMPERIETPLRFTSIAAGARGSACATEATGALHCWGKFHPLTVSDRLPPGDTEIRRVARGVQFSDVATGWDYACGLTFDKRLLCW